LRIHIRARYALFRNARRPSWLAGNMRHALRLSRGHRRTTFNVHLLSIAHSWQGAATCHPRLPRLPLERFPRLHPRFRGCPHGPPPPRAALVALLGPPESRALPEPVQWPRRPHAAPDPRPPVSAPRTPSSAGPTPQRECRIRDIMLLIRPA